MIQPASMLPQFIYLSIGQQKKQQIELQIIVLTEKQLNQKESISQKHKDNFKIKKIIFVYEQGLKKLYISPKKVTKFKIEQSCSVQFTKEVLQMNDFIGISSTLLSSAYKFSRKSQKGAQIEIYLKNSQQLIEKVISLVKSRHKSQQWANGRGDIEGSPQYFVNIIQNMKKQYNLESTIIKGDDLLEKGFRLLHAVGRGSSFQPIFANISYQGNKKSDKWIAFVGKGVCFDAGGLDKKTPQAMKIMYLDKHGACSVLAAFQHIVKEKLNLNLTCSIGLVENVIGPKSYRPADIIKSRKGLTVKIQDTDAQGRLILADAMNWTQEKYKTQLLIELSTLTYSNIAALGNKYAGMFTNDCETADRLISVGKKTHQFVWRMPVDQEHHELLECQEADCLNDLVEDNPGGSIAAAFLQKFVQKNTKWVHLDIAGTGIIDSKGTGWGTILLVEYLKQICQKNNVQ